MLLVQIHSNTFTNQYPPSSAAMRPLAMASFACVVLLFNLALCTAFAPIVTIASTGRLLQLRAANRATSLRMAEETSNQQINRRATLIQGAAFFAALSLPYPAVAGSNVEALRSELKSIVDANKDFGPTMVRLAWHSSGTYDRMSKTGGSGKGTIRFKDELGHGANAGLDKAVAQLEPLKTKFPDVSYADLYTLAGVVAIETLGGPKVGWRAGRVDSMDPKDVTPDGRLPDADKGEPSKTSSHLRDIFGRMGFNDQEIVALAGAHALGRCHPDASGYVGPWTPTPTTFNNLYFTLLLNLKWEPNTVNGKFQYKDPSGKLMMLPSDIVLIQDEKFKSYVEAYAKDQNKFFKDFAAAFQKLEELGTSGLV